jgi:hypothetical protein
VIASDTDHEIPRAEQLLGVTLSAKGDSKGALEHLHRYLELSPKAEDAYQVKQMIALIEETAAKKP